MAIYTADIVLKTSQEANRKRILENELNEKMIALSDIINDTRQLEETLKIAVRSFFNNYKNIIKYVTINKDSSFLFIVDSNNIVTDEAFSPFNLKARKSTIIVQSVEDLPAPSNGVHQLADNTEYQFNGNIMSTSSLKYGTNTICYGFHWANDVFIYLGAGAALVTDNVAFNMRFMTVAAPNGTIFNLSAGVDKEFLTNLCAFVNCVSLGTISGYRVPSLKAVNCENYNTGLTFTGTSEKVLIDGSPFRNDTDANSVAITFDSNFSTQVIDFTGNYFKNLSGVGAKIETGATISNYGLFRGNIFEDVATSTEGFDHTSPEWDFKANYPIQDSDTYGAFYLSEDVAVTITTQNTWTWIDFNNNVIEGITQRITITNNGVITSTDRRSNVVKIISTGVLKSTANNTTYEFSIFINDQLVVGSETTVEIRTNNFQGFTTNALVELIPDDVVTFYIRNTSGTTDAVINNFQVSID